MKEDKIKISPIPRSFMDKQDMKWLRNVTFYVTTYETKDQFKQQCVEFYNKHKNKNKVKYAFNDIFKAFYTAKEVEIKDFKVHPFNRRIKAYFIWKKRRDDQERNLISEIKAVAYENSTYAFKKEVFNQELYNKRKGYNKSFGEKLVEADLDDDYDAYEDLGGLAACRPCETGGDGYLQEGQYVWNDGTIHDYPDPNRE